LFEGLEVEGFFGFHWVCVCLKGSILVDSLDTVHFTLSVNEQFDEFNFANLDLYKGRF